VCWSAWAPELEHVGLCEGIGKDGREGLGRLAGVTSVRRCAARAGEPGPRAADLASRLLAPISAPLMSRARLVVSAPLISRPEYGEPLPAAVTATLAWGDRSAVAVTDADCGSTALGSARAARWIGRGRLRYRERWRRGAGRRRARDRVASGRVRPKIGRLDPGTRRWPAATRARRSRPERKPGGLHRSSAPQTGRGTHGAPVMSRAGVTSRIAAAS
jgi:hypothetical protein